MNKKEELIKALQEEFKSLEPSLDPHIQQDIKNEFNYTIEYLKTGYYRIADIEDYDLLEAAINDFETLYNDYCK